MARDLPTGCCKKEAPKEVKIKLYGEYGCPYCREFVRGPWNSTVHALEHVHGVTFEFNPWGNAYFIIDKCGGAGVYDADARNCFNRHCGPASDRSSDCFAGSIVAQHGPRELEADRYIACAKHMASSDFGKYMPFISCLYESSPKFADADWQSCASLVGFQIDALKTCYAGAKGRSALVSEAKDTPVHPGVPFVLVNDVEASLEGLDLLDLVCTARGELSSQEEASPERTSMMPIFLGVLLITILCGVGLIGVKFNRARVLHGRSHSLNSALELIPTTKSQASTDQLGAK